MNKLKVNINSLIRKKYNIRGSEINFEELEIKIKLANARDRLKKLNKIAKETGLSKMTNREINNIIADVRKNARSSR
jgi:hypothetical protein